MAVAPPATPQRQMPGLFVNTPAPSRPAAQRMQNQLAPPQTALTTSNGSTAPATPLLTPIVRAAKTINDSLDYDRRFPELERYVTQGISTDYEDSNNPAWAPFQPVKKYMIPERILEQYNNAQVATIMGLFAELNHAWMVIDNALYLWDFTHPNPDLVGFEGQPHSITAVGLVRPRAGVFVETLEYVLVVATQAEIMLIGVACERGAMGVHGLTLYQTNMRVANKQHEIRTIVGSQKTGRIFLAGPSNDDVLELSYQQEEMWFKNRCGKINHVSKSPLASVLPTSFLGYGKSTTEHVREMVLDDSRGLLYTLSSASTIRVFHLKDNNVLTLSLTVGLQLLKTSMSHIANTTNLLKPEVSVISLCPISYAESARLSLVATLSTGHRIFLSATSGGSWGSPNANDAPTSMQPHHIKAPPSTTPSTRISYRFGPGYSLCFFQRSTATLGDTLSATALDTGRLAVVSDQTQPSRFIESVLNLELGGTTEAVGLLTPPSTATTTPQGYGNELAVQFDKPICEIAILTNNGIQTIRRRRLVDVFAAIIRLGGSVEEGLSGELKKFARLYGRDEASATALSVACGQGSEVTADHRVAQVADGEVLQAARTAFIEFGGKASVNENTIDQTAPTIENVRPSHRHSGLALYIARLVRSTWKSTIIKEVVTPRGIMIDPAVPLSKTQAVQQDLVELKTFLESNSTEIQGLSGPEALRGINSKSEELALQGEARAMSSLMLLLGNIIEGMAFVQMLFDEQVNELLLKLPDAARQKVRELTFEALFCKSEGRELAKDLVKAIVNRNIEKGSSVDAVADALRRRCGSFCSADDVVIFKAREQVKKASEAGPNSDAARILLNESLKSFGRVTSSLTMEHLRWAVDHYSELGFYAGAINLSLSVAQASDPGRRALAWMRDGCPAQDPRKTQYDSRVHCYEIIKGVIVAVDAAANSTPITIDGQLSTVGRRYNEAHDEISRSDDEVFQNYLFDWYLEIGKTKSLLENTSPFVASYLERKAADSRTHADLLWTYHARHHDFFAAALVQLKLAKSDFDLDLKQRIEYLSNAKTNASTRLPGIAEVRTSRTSRQELLREASELLEVADIQDALIERMQDDARFDSKPEQKATALRTLNGQIKPVSDLYNEFADPGSYWDICLLIYASADYREARDIEQTWIRYIDALDATYAPSSDWAVLRDRLESLGRKVRLSEPVFALPFLLPHLIRYRLAVRRDRNFDLADFPIDFFLNLNVPEERLVTVLDYIYTSDEPAWSSPPFRLLVAEGLVDVIAHWFAATGHGQGEVFGDAERAADVADVLRRVVSEGVLSPRSNAEKFEDATRLREEVEAYLR